MNPDDKIAKIMTNTTEVTKILQQGVRTALLQHKLMGNPICVWRDNKVAWIPPEQL